MLLGLLLGVGPEVLRTGLKIFVPGLSLAGASFYDLAFALIPIALAYAVINSGRKRAASPGSRSPAFAS